MPARLLLLQRRVDGCGAGVGVGGGPLSPYVRSLSSRECADLDARCARWLFLSELPLPTTDAPPFQAFCKGLNAAYKPPSRFPLAGPLLDREFAAQSVLVDAFVARRVAPGDIIIGGDGWTDRQRNSICNVMLFTPDPLYVETGMWPEQRHTADNTAAFFMKRIEALGKRSVCAFVSDTEPKMRDVWGSLQEEYP